MKFTEAQLEAAIIELLGGVGIPHTNGMDIKRTSESDVLILDDLREYLRNAYAVNKITESEIGGIIRRLETLPHNDLYSSNSEFMRLLTDGFDLKREDSKAKDFRVSLIDYSDADQNKYRIVNQLEIVGTERRIPDGILYINGLPLVVFEFKSAIREDATIHDAYKQLTVRYRRDIPELMKYNALCVISDGVNSKIGGLFAPYDFFYAWRKVDGNELVAVDGISSLHTMINGAFNRVRLRDIIQNFIYVPDNSTKDEKIVCRYPQYYAARKLYNTILAARRPNGDGRGGTYFGATGCGKSYTMMFLTRLLMRSPEFANPTIVLITDRTDLDDQLSKQFVRAKKYIGDENVISVESRAQLRELLRGHEGGGVFLTTIHKFTEDTKMLTDRSNVICISDEAHRSQINLDQKIKVTDKGIKKTYGFAKHLHDSLPNAVYVGFTGTPIDSTLDVFGPISDSYTMTESVTDEITVRIVYEGRAAKVVLDNSKLSDIEKYYDQCAIDGANEHQIEESKKCSANMNVILGDPDRINALARDFVEHYETRVREGASVMGKALFVASDRSNAYEFYKAVISLRPDWAIERTDDKDAPAISKIKLVMTRNKDDEKSLYDMLGTSDYRKELDRQFKNAKSNFKIAIVVDMWLTGFDVPELDTIYIDKPIQRHSLIQTISRVNRKFEGKDKGLVVDYIGIKKQMGLALAMFSKGEEQNIEEINTSVIVVKDHLDLLNKIFHKFDKSPYFTGSPVAQLNCLNNAAEFVQITDAIERRFMDLVKRLKSAYDICVGSGLLTQQECDLVHFYIAVRSIVFKLTRGDAPDISQMNARVREMIQDALVSDGVEEIFKLGEDNAEIDLFGEDYLAKVEKIKLPNTKIKLLEKLLERAICEFKKVNKFKAVDFSNKFSALVEKYNERKESDVLRSEVLEEFTDEIIGLYRDLQREKESFKDMGINFEEKAFYDILKELAHKYQFEYPDNKLIPLAQAVADVVNDKVRYTDAFKREDIKAELKVDLILLLAKHDYPPVDRDEVYKEIFEQAENFKRNNG